MFIENADWRRKRLVVERHHRLLRRQGEEREERHPSATINNEIEASVAYEQYSDIVQFFRMYQALAS
jgi:hypothetical protein